MIMVSYLKFCRDEKPSEFWVFKNSSITAGNLSLEVVTYLVNKIHEFQ